MREVGSLKSIKRCCAVPTPLKNPPGKAIAFQCCSQSHPQVSCSTAPSWIMREELGLNTGLEARKLSTHPSAISAPVTLNASRGCILTSLYIWPKKPELSSADEETNLPPNSTTALIQLEVKPFQKDLCTSEVCTAKSYPADKTFQAPSGSMPAAPRRGDLQPCQDGGCLLLFALQAGQPLSDPEHLLSDAPFNSDTALPCPSPFRP